MGDRAAEVSAELRGVLFDFAGVLTCPLDDAHHAWCRSEGVLTDQLEDVLAGWQRLPAANNPIFLVETGAMPTASFERILVERLVVGGAPRIAALGLVSRMLRYFRPEPAMVAAARALCNAGVRVGLVTNIWSDLRPWESFDLPLDAVVSSRDCGARKPDPTVYKTAARMLGLPAARCAFVDDNLRNVEGAARAGMLGILHDDPSTTWAILSVSFGERYLPSRFFEKRMDG
jgi:putative hydrolase of the HAD superfamily